MKLFRPCILAFGLTVLAAATAFAVQCDSNCTYDAAAWYRDCLRSAAEGSSSQTDASCQAGYDRQLNYCRTCTR